MGIFTSLKDAIIVGFEGEEAFFLCGAQQNTLAILLTHLELFWRHLHTIITAYTLITLEGYYDHKYND